MKGMKESFTMRRESLFIYVLNTFPSRLIFSFKYFEDNTADTITLNAPKGVTREAGANA